MILCSNPREQYAAHREEIRDAIDRVLEGDRYILGPEVAAFEKEFAAYCGVSEGIGVGSGTEALHLALRAIGIGRADEVITVSHTAVATAVAIRLCGATPVFVDIDERTYTIDPDKVEAAITPKTKAIVPVHLYGCPADLHRLQEISKRHGIPLVEDCAQAHGARFGGRRVGSFGKIAAFSFYPTKNLGAIGDGGMVVTSDKELAARVRLLREYGWAERYVSHIEGWNSRLDELQAAILRVKLRHLDEDNEKRRAIAARYDDALRREPTLKLPVDFPGHVYHLYVMYVVYGPGRDQLLSHLRERGIVALVHYPVPIHLQPAYQPWAMGHRLGNTERAARHILSLPMYPELASKDQQTVIQAVIDGVT